MAGRVREPQQAINHRFRDGQSLWRQLTWLARNEYYESSTLFVLKQVIKQDGLQLLRFLDTKNKRFNIPRRFGIDAIYSG